MSRAPEQVQDPLRWCAALALAFWLACLPHLTAVPHAYFDEVHYLPAARELLALDEFTNREHPLLGKELIALGIALFGDNPVGWRLLPTLLGTLALFGAASGPVPPVDPQRLNAAGSVYLTRPNLAHYTRTPDEFSWRAGELLTAIADGTLSVTVSHRYRLHEAQQAHRDLQGRQTVGSVVLIP